MQNPCFPCQGVERKLGRLMVKSFALRLSQSRLQRHLFLLAISLLAISIIGYHFGTFDQSVHIPFLKKYVDESLFPNDPFLDLRFQHFSYFWFFFQPFYRLGILEPAMFAVHILATYLTFFAVWKLSDMLFENAVTNLLAVVALIIPHLGFAGFPAIEFSLLNRTFVLPFLLWAIVFFLRRWYLLTFALLGLLYNLHVTSVNFALAMILFACLTESRRVGWRIILAGMAVFVVCALPVLIWKAGKSPVDLMPRFEWFSIISRGMAYHLFFLFGPYVPILVITLCGLGTLAQFFVARRRNPSPRYDRTLTLFIGAILAILVVEVVTAMWLPITILIQLQIIRAGVFALFFGYLYFANYIVSRWEAGQLTRFDGALLTGAFVTSPHPVVPLLILALQSFIVSIHWRRLATALTLLVTFAGTLALVLNLDLWDPGIYVYPHPSPWYEAQYWAKTNTPKDAVFITPPQIWSFYDSEWRVFSERSTVVTLSELFEASFAPEYMYDQSGRDGRKIYGWKSRFADLAPGALEQFQGYFFENQVTTAKAFCSLASDQVLNLAHKYGATYMVVNKPCLREWPVMYENSEFVIYKFP
jgi:hypothetical protein